MPRLAVQTPEITFTCPKKGCGATLDKVDARDRERKLGAQYTCANCGTVSTIGERVTRRTIDVGGTE
jgi:predicted RNA-binding Zn-ribbon protein involved in translation (DUF1610 family)